MTPIKVPVAKVREIGPANFDRGKVLNCILQLAPDLGGFSLIESNQNPIWKELDQLCQVTIGQLDFDALGLANSAALRDVFNELRGSCMGSLNRRIKTPRNPNYKALTYQMTKLRRLSLIAACGHKFMGKVLEFDVYVNGWSLFYIC